MYPRIIEIKNAKEHNLQSVDLILPTQALIVFTGISGSGKSSLAFDTLFAEGQRRYIQSLSVSQRRLLEDVKKPNVEEILGLSPTICIAQKSISRNPRSSVGTITEISDYLRVIFARLAENYCPISKERVTPISKESILIQVFSLPEEERFTIFAPIATEKKGSFKERFDGFLQKGFLYARIDGTVQDLSEEFFLDPQKTHTIELLIDQIKNNKKNETRIKEALLSALEFGENTLIIQTEKEELFFSTYGFSQKSQKSYPALQPHDFSANSPLGMCPNCHGLGEKEEFSLDKILDQEKSIAEDPCLIAPSYQTVRYGNIYRNLAKLFGFSVTTPWKELAEEAKEIYLFGRKEKWIKMSFTHPETKKRWREYVSWKGVIYEAEKKLEEAKSEGLKDKLNHYRQKELCSFCLGSGIKPYPSASRFQNKSFQEIQALSIKEALDFFSHLSLTSEEKKIGEELIKELIRRLKFLEAVGLDYLQLSRKAPTLSGGEAQRVHLASHVGSGLVGITYILDEPSIGLHPRDNERLIKTLISLKEAGNSVIVVEHDEETILAADHIVDFGPKAGIFGGKIVLSGTVEELLNHPTSLTGAYLSGKEKISFSSKRVPTEKKIYLKKASCNNLKNVDLTIPLGLMVLVTGVSGSGKSSLITETLAPALQNLIHKSTWRAGTYEEIIGAEEIKKVIVIDQSPIGRTPRSNPATYLKIFDEIRLLFSHLPDAKAQGFAPGRFSFNCKEGSCSKCLGLGTIRIDMDFMEDAFLPCDQCNGQRFDGETLSILFKGKSIKDVLDMTMQEALDFFSNQPTLARKIELVCQVGLNYLTLGQIAPTLSGGEAQRIKLAKELSKTSKNCFYILDEPTTGLHLYDIHALLEICQKLVDQGNTLLVIEHNIEVIQAADWVIDLGPEAADQGGKIIFTGTPKDLAKEDSPTGRALRKKEKKTKVALQKKEIKSIIVEGASENNLKNIDLSLPLEKITCITGPSGSGKSSFAFDTLYAEGNRRYVDTLSTYARQFVNKSSKPKYTRLENLLATIAIEQKNQGSTPRSTLGTLTEIYDYLRILFAHKAMAYCPETGEKIESISKEFVLEKVLDSAKEEKMMVLAPIELLKNESFEQCKKRLLQRGFLRIELDGKIYELDEPITFQEKQRHQIALVIDRFLVSLKEKSRIFEALQLACSISDGQMILVTDQKREFFSLSFAVPSTGKSYPRLSPQSFSFNHIDGMCLKCNGLGQVKNSLCLECQGSRLNALSRNAKLENKTLFELSSIPLEELSYFLHSLPIYPLMEELFSQLHAKLEFLLQLGLNYLHLHRQLATLSHGEIQRVRLAKQLGSHLRGILYVLDEPTIGMHPQDIHLLNQALIHLKELGNTLVIVEHDPQTIAIADYLVEFGPQAGKKGGHLIFSGSVQECTNTPTGLWLSQTKQLPLKSSTKAEQFFLIKNVKKYNLKGFDFSLPLYKLSVLTGVSGSGKSTLMHEVIRPYVEKQIKNNTGPFLSLVTMDQTPLFLTERSDVGTFSDLLPHLREFYASLASARTKGLLPGHFSTNHHRGMCSHCQGLGYRNIDLLFMPAIQVPCEKCQGLRLQPLSLEVTYKEKNFGELLASTIDELYQLFFFLPKVEKVLKNLQDCGLGYLQVGQKMTTLSHGEAQRIKLCKELSKARKKEILYLLDEPTTGLSFDDIEKLLPLLEKIVAKGNTMLIIEHNTEFMKRADYFFELGPTAGEKGGELTAEGDYETFIHNPHSTTAPYLSLN